MFTFNSLNSEYLRKKNFTTLAQFRGKETGKPVQQDEKPLPGTAQELPVKAPLSCLINSKVLIIKAYCMRGAVLTSGQAVATGYLWVPGQAHLCEETSPLGAIGLGAVLKKIKRSDRRRWRLL
jgi:hypothetical protein